MKCHGPPQLTCDRNVFSVPSWRCLVALGCSGSASGSVSVRAARLGGGCSSSFLARSSSASGASRSGTAPLRMPPRLNVSDAMAPASSPISSTSPKTLVKLQTTISGSNSSTPATGRPSLSTDAAHGHLLSTGEHPRSRSSSPTTHGRHRTDADDANRRLCDQALFKAIYIDEDNDVRVGYRKPYDGLSIPGLHADALSWAARQGKGPSGNRDQGWPLGREFTHDLFGVPS